MKKMGWITICVFSTLTICGCEDSAASAAVRHNDLSSNKHSDSVHQNQLLPRQMSDDAQDTSTHGISTTPDHMVIACVGNSITYGRMLASSDKYPFLLGRNLGPDHAVHNFGVSGRYVRRDGLVGGSYWMEDAFRQVFAVHPTLILVMLGTNDSKEAHWAGRDTFTQDYEALIDTLATIECNPEIIIVLPIPALEEHSYTEHKIRPAYVDTIVSIQREFAQERGLPIIDAYSPFMGKPEYYQDNDGVHPNEKGSSALADIVYEGILDHYEKTATSVLR